MVREVRTGVESDDADAGWWLIAQGLNGLSCLPTIKGILVAVTKAK